MPRQTEPQQRRVHFAGEQRQGLSQPRRQRNPSAEAGGQHAHMADDLAERRARCARAVSGLVERQEPVAETVHAVANLRRDRQEHRPPGLRLLLRRDRHGTHWSRTVVAYGPHRILGGHIHGHDGLHRRYQHGKSGQWRFSSQTFLNLLPFFPSIMFSFHFLFFFFFYLMPTLRRYLLYTILHRSKSPTRRDDHPT